MVEGATESSVLNGLFGRARLRIIATSRAVAHRARTRRAQPRSTVLGGLKANVIVAVAVVATATVWHGEAAAADSFDAANATYEFAGDTFTLAEGKAQIMGHGGLPDAPDTIPVGYTLAESASASLDGGNGAVIALYRGFGANLEWIVLFAFEESDGTYTQTAASPAYEDDARVESLSVDDGTVSLGLLVVGDADKELPHYEQKLTQPLTLKFTVDNGKFVKAE